MRSRLVDKFKVRWRKVGVFASSPSREDLARSTGSTVEAQEDQEVKSMTDELATEKGQISVGRYYAEHVRLSPDREPHEQLRDVLDAAEEKEWHLVGVAGGLADGGVVLFWDTKRPSFGRTSRF
jgi:hypothetical protein